MRNSNAKWRPNIRKDGSVRWHKARVPGTIRNSRKPGGNGFRGNKQWKAHHG